MKKIIYYPQEILLKPTISYVFNNDSHSFLSKLKREMQTIMMNHHGIGLAANQIGVHFSIFLMNIGENEFFFINPKILSTSSEKITFVEGCLSFPNIKIEKERFKTIILSWHDINNHLHTQEFSDLESVCIQHETDHLQGITFIDDLSKLKKNMILKKVQKFSVKNK